MSSNLYGEDDGFFFWLVLQMVFVVLSNKRLPLIDRVAIWSGQNK